MKAKHVNKTSQEALKVTDLMVTNLATESREEPFLHWAYTQSPQHDDSPSSSTIVGGVNLSSRWEI